MTPGSKFVIALLLYLVSVSVFFFYRIFKYHKISNLRSDVLMAVAIVPVLLSVGCAINGNYCAYLNTLWGIVLVMSIFTSISLLGIVPAYLTYRVYYRLIGRHFYKQINPKHVGGFDYSLVCGSHSRFWGAGVPMAFGSLIFWFDVFDVVESFVLSYWNVISIPFYLCYFRYTLNHNLFPIKGFKK